MPSASPRPCYSSSPSANRTPGRGCRHTLKIVADTCILKLATFPAANNPSALIVQLGLKGLVEWWASPAILEEYGYVVATETKLLAEVFEVMDLCYPLTELDVIRHEPDNRFIECALGPGI